MNTPVKQDKYLPIENYGIIGNLHTVALVSIEGSIDFMCFRRFDSPFVFGKMLDAGKGGYFSIMPNMPDMITKQMYLPDTNILLTRFFSDQGIVEIIDYMPVEEEEIHCSVIRKVSTIRGEIAYDMHCAPRFNYTRSGHTTNQQGNGILFTPENLDQPPLLLQSDAKLEIAGNDATASFTLKGGESKYFLLQAADGDPITDIALYVKNTYQETINFWQNWIDKTTYKGRWQEVVRRSALTLKLLISRQHGSMVAAPTFSLPEAIGRGRNWDYRYTWIRDAAFSMHAFLELGFLEEAEKFLEWVKRQSTQSELQLMFKVDGKTNIDEEELPELEGYKGSKPVRIGNDAHKQTQMDIYGELLETIYIFAMHGGDITYDYWKIIVSYIDYVIDNWQQPDHSIWEVRGKKRVFLFSGVMSWVALDRAIKVGDHFSFPYDLLKWRDARDKIFRTVHEDYWSEEKQAFVQFKGSRSLDASAMMMPMLNMISAQSQKWLKTMVAIEKELSSDVLMYRYRETDEEVDGLPGNEGTFTMCSFWFVECLALAGDSEKANEYFEKMLGYANHLGLYSEQLGMRGEHLGNFPQAFTHLALISAAIALDNEKKVNTSNISAKAKGIK